MARKKNNVIELASRANREERRQLVERLFDEHVAALRLFFRGRLVPDDEIEDLVQEMFSRLMGLDGLELKMTASTGSNRAFLLTMANNLVVDMQRRLMVRKDYDIQQQDIEGGRVNEQTPEIIVSARRDLEAMKAVIMRMRPAWRKAFILNRFRNMSYRDIAEHMDVTVKQVESYIVQAMARIRQAQRQLKKRGK